MLLQMHPVILSGARTSRSEAPAESKDPYLAQNAIRRNHFGVKSSQDERES